MNNRVASTISSLALCLAAAAGWSCSNSAVESKSSPSPPAATAAPAGPLTAQHAFHEMYKPAFQWSRDVMPLMINSGEAPGVKNEGGQAGMWTAIFVSPGKREARTFHYAAAEVNSEIGKGVTIGRIQPWGGPTPKSKPFMTSEFSVDSDAAYDTAAKDAAGWLKKNPSKKLVVYLVSESRFAGPTWYFMWGDKKSGYLAYVDAMTGQTVKGK